MSLLDRSTFAKLVEQTLHVLHTLSSKEEVETEIRFRGLSEKLTRRDFSRINEQLDRATADKERVEDVVEIVSDIRRISTNDKVVYNSKEVSWASILKDYNIKFSVSRESSVDAPKIFVPLLKRSRKRNSYYLAGKMLRMDVSEVTYSEINGSSFEVKDVNYEVEMEILDIRNIEYDVLSKKVNFIFSIVHGTIYHYTEDVKKEMFIFFQNSMGGCPDSIGGMGRKRIFGEKKYNHGRDRGESVARHVPSSFDARFLATARTMKFQDAVAGGVAGGDIYYTITEKTDGVRKLLAVNGNKLFLITPPNQLNLVSILPTNEMHGLIMDGEDVPLENRKLLQLKRILHLFIIFDCCSIPTEEEGRFGDPSIQALNHRQRMDKASYWKKILDQMVPNKTMIMKTKTFLSITNPQSFFVKTRSVVKNLPHMGYKTDGVVFTPDNSPYKTAGNRKVPVDKRNVTWMPEILKLKYRKDLTTDFIPDLSSKKLIVSGSRRIFSNDVNVDWDNDMLKEIKSGETVVEFEWDFDKERYTPIRIRYDKPFPNGAEVADDNYRQLMQGMSLEDVVDENTKFLRKYHNVIKRNLFRDSVNMSKASTDKDLVLLDIGSGRGGDVSKWFPGFDKVFAVEPNKEHIVELERRVKNFGAGDKVKIINSGGEDYNTITKEMGGVKADVVAFMLSLSFFWKSKENLQDLGRTVKNNLKEGGMVIFLTINGDAIDELRNPKFGNGPPIEKLSLHGGVIVFDFEPKEDGAYKIKFSKTIVEEQEEYKVYISELAEVLGMRLRSHEKADKEDFLPKSSLQMTELYSYGYLM